MPHEALRKFAEELKSAREAKDITLQQIATRTKIDLKFLQAIEDCKFDVVPELYMRAFIKEYSQAIELDPNEIIKKFDLSIHGKTEEKHTPDTKSEIPQLADDPKSAPIEKSINHAADQNDAQPVKNNPNIIFIAIAGVVIIVMAYFLFFDNSSKEMITQNNSHDTVTENMPAFEVDSVKTPSEIKTADDDSLRLALNTSKRVWIKVVSDKNIVKIEGMVEAGSSLIYKAAGEFRVVVGNAGSVAIALNGKPIDNIGNQGEVRNIIISPDTVIAYTLLIPTKDENKSQQKN